MAINVGTAIAFLELDMSGFKNSLSAAGSDLKNFATGGDLQNLTSAMSGVGSELTKKVTLPIAGIGAAAVGASMDFEAQMSKVKAISGAVGEEFDGLRNQAIQLGADTNFSASEAANGMEDLASAGFKTTEIMTAMPGVLDLAAAGAVSISDAASIAGSTLRGFGLEAEKVGHVGDVLAKLAGDTNAGIMDTGEAMKYIAPVSKALGISLEDTSAAIGMLSDAGIQGGQAGTVLRGALINLAKPTDASAKLMENLGIQVFDANGKMKPLGEVVSILKDKTADLTSEQKASAFATMFGKEAMSGMLTLVDQGPEKLNKLSTSLSNCDGASKEMAGTMQDNLKGSVEAMKGSIETAAIKIGDVLAPMIKQCANYIADLVNKFSALPKETQEFIVKIALVAAAVGPVLIILAKLIESVRTVISVFTGITKIVNVVSALPALLNPPVLIIIGIIMLIAFIVYEVIKHWDQLKAYFQAFFDFCKNIFNKLMEFFKWVFDGIGNFIDWIVIQLVLCVIALVNFSAIQLMVGKWLGVISQVS
jgi:TP901 family phage tail tape measure protein